MSFEQSMIAAGLRPRDIVADGRWRRCATDTKPKKRNGAYLLSLDGRRGWFRDWADPLGGVIEWRDDSAVVKRPIDVTRIERQRREEQQRRRDAVRGARAFWEAAKPFRGHPYIESKGLAALGCSGLRVSENKLVVPVRIDAAVVSVQTIDKDGSKRFWPGASVKAGAYVIDRVNAPLTAVCEGLATGLAVFQIVRAARVIVAFDAGNMAPAVQRIRPAGSVVIVADNDHGTQAKRGTNPGIESAQRAAELIGAGVTWPQGIEGTDFADALHELGHSAVRRLERQIVGAAKYVLSG